MSPNKKHADHDHIHARLQRYAHAFEKEDIKALLTFLDENDFVYTQFGTGRRELKRAELERELNLNFENFHDLKMKTVSLHGHKNFTAWEWVMKYRHALDNQGNRQSKEKSEKQKLRGCSLMWWNDNDKIVKQHEYLQSCDPNEAELQDETEAESVLSVAR